MPASRSANASVRALCATLAALALLLRIAIPSGWMPMAGPDGVRLALCSGVAAEAMPGMAMDGGGHGPAKDQHAPPERPCDFAAAALALDASPPPLLAAPPASPVYVATSLARDLAVGRGLAAPPPPATGPPHLG